MALTPEQQAVADEILPGRTLTEAQERRLVRILAFCEAQVEILAPAAPEVVKQEACLRLVAYTWSRPGNRLTERAVNLGGEVRTSFVVDTNMLRASGCLSALRPWRRVSAS